MNAIAYLKNDHQSFKNLIKKISGSGDRQVKKKLFSKLCQALLEHEDVEQKIWYPALKRNTNLDLEIRHLISEEKHVEKEIKVFDEIKNEEEWDKRFNKFKNELEHHSDEEEKKLFPNVEEVLSKADLEDLGKSMLKFKEESF